MAKSVKVKRKLLVKKEIVRKLLGEELEAVRGGWIWSWPNDCGDSDDTCPPCED